MASAKDVYEAALIELNKVQAPSLLLEDFNYLFNKAVNQYINKKYATYDMTQQATDDLRVLKATVHLKPYLVNSVEENSPQAKAINKMYGATYETYLPIDYMHVLNCVCSFEVKGGDYKCYDDDSYVAFQATRLTSDAWPVILNNFYMRPSYKRPYYYIHSLSANQQANIQALRDNIKVAKDSDFKSEDINTAQTQTSRVITLGGGSALVNSSRDEIGEKFGEEITRVGNPYQPRMEIRYGKDNTTFKLVDVQVDYIKVPQYIRLTQDQIEMTRDTSQILEWPDYVCQEIINELVNIIMENSSDPRLQTHIPISQSIASPAPQQAQQSSKK